MRDLDSTQHLGWVWDSPVAEEGEEFQAEAKSTISKSHRIFKECTPAELPEGHLCTGWWRDQGSGRDVQVGVYLGNSMADSSCCLVETNVILWSNYPAIKNTWIKKKESLGGWNILKIKV